MQAAILPMIFLQALQDTHEADAAAERTVISELQIRVTCSIGVARGYACDVDAVLCAADAGLYQDKRSGNNRDVSNPQIALPESLFEGPHHASYRIPA